MADMGLVAQVAGGSAAGALSARVLDEYVGDPIYTVTAFGRTFSLRAGALASLLALGLVVAGVLPDNTLLLSAAAGGFAYEATVEVGDDLAAVMMGIPPPGAPAPEAAPPSPVVMPTSYTAQLPASPADVQSAIAYLGRFGMPAFI